MQGITYWVISDPTELERFINSNVKSEWEKDNHDDGIDSKTDDWLMSLRKREWRVKSIDISRVQPDPLMISNKKFAERLDKRSNELRRSISGYHVVIWPIILRGEDQRLKDGYCRFTTLRKMGISRTLAYVGRLKTSY